MDKLQHFAKNESGVTAIEYGIIAAAMGMMLIAVMPAVEGPLDALFQAINAGFDTVAAPAEPG